MKCEYGILPIRQQLGTENVGAQSNTGEADDNQGSVPARSLIVGEVNHDNRLEEGADEYKPPGIASLPR